MKKLLSTALVLLMMMAILAGCSETPSSTSSSEAEISSSTGDQDEGDTDPDELSGTISLWTWTDNVNDVYTEFNKAYPNIVVENQIFGGDEYKTKLLTTLQSGSGIPDMFMLEEGYIYEFLDSDAIENLSDWGFEEKMADYYPYMLAQARGSDGNIRAVNYQASPVCFWYLRDACEQWLGTSDEKELAAMMGSWDEILALAEKVYNDSDGTVYLWPNAIEMVKVVGYSYEPFVRDNKFSVSQDWYDLLDTMRAYHESGYLANLDSWGQDWAVQWNAGNLLIRVMPSWDFFTDWDQNEGNVGVIKPFENAYEGGSFVCMWSGGQNKELVNTYLTFLTSDEFQKANMETYNQVPGKATVAQELAASYTSPRFGGQNLMETYYEINNNVADIVPDRYTRAMQNLFQKHANEGVLNGLDNETIINNFIMEAKDQYPDVDYD